MAVLDAKLEMSDAQSVASLGASSAVTSTDILDFGTHENTWGTAINPDIGEGGELEWNVHVNTILVGASANITCSLVTGAAVSSGAITSATVLATLNIPAVSAAGYKKSVHVPAGTVQRYVATTYLVGTASASITTGALDSHLRMDHEKID